MQTASVYDIAQSMIRMWGRKAMELAGQYAQAMKLQGRVREAEKWISVQRVVIQYLRLSEGPIGFKTTAQRGAC
jgi:hypothetical protein